MIVSTRVREFLERTRDAHPPLSQEVVSFINLNLHCGAFRTQSARKLAPKLQPQCDLAREAAQIAHLVFELIIHVLFKRKPWQPHGEHNASRSRRDVPAEQDCIILHKLHVVDKMCCCLAITCRTLPQREETGSTSLLVGMCTCYKTMG